MDDALRFDPAKAERRLSGRLRPDRAPVGQARRGRGRRNTAAAPTGRWRSRADTIAFVNAAQHWARDETRLGIPVLFHEEALHGYMAPEATSFPQAIAHGRQLRSAIWSRRVSARHRRARCARMAAVLALSPVVDIARDPRWGRIEETFGEDPYLCGEMGVAAVEGLQGDGKSSWRRARCSRRSST